MISVYLLLDSSEISNDTTVDFYDVNLCSPWGFFVINKFSYL